MTFEKTLEVWSSRFLPPEATFVERMALMEKQWGLFCTWLNEKRNIDTGGKEVKAMVDLDKCISYLVNQNGHRMPITLREYGSCTPKGVLDDWIKGRTPDEIINLADDCDKWVKEHEQKN